MPIDRGGRASGDGGSRALELGSVALSFAVHETGAIEVTSPWHPHVWFGPEQLAAAAGDGGRRLEIAGDVLTIRCTNGGAAYALGPADPSGVRPARLLRSW